MNPELLLRTTFILLSMFFVSNGKSQVKNQSTAGLRATDSVQINALAKAFFKAISFQNVDSLKTASLNKLFVESGQLIGNTGPKPFFLNVWQYIDGAKEECKKEQIKIFEMNEKCFKTDIFGKIATRFSVYNLHVKTILMDFDVSGMYAFQFIKQNDTWLITSVTWDKESSTSIIPHKYLCR